MAAKQFYHDIDLAKVGQLVNARIQNVTNTERSNLGLTLGASNAGLQVWDTEDNAPYVWSGSLWIRDAMVVNGDVVFRGTIDASTSLDAQATAAIGNQYVVATAGTLSMTGVTFTPSAVVEVGDVVLFTSSTEATVFQRNTEAASTTVAGIVEIATQEEVNTGTDALRVVTPSTLAGSALATSVSNNTSSIGTINTNIGTIGNLTTTATDLVGAINEHETQINTNTSNIGTINTNIGTIGSLTTTATDLVGAINEHETQINTNTSNIGTNTSNIGTINTNIGTIGNLTTTATDLVGAINEHETQINTNASDIGTINTNIGTIGNLTTLASNLVGAINEHETQINTNTSNIGTVGNLTTTATDLVGAINEHETQINTNASNIGTIGNLTTTATDLVGAINEHETQINTNTSNIGTINTNIGTIGNLTTTATDLVGAINEHETQINTNASDIGSLESFTGSGTALDTTATNLAAAVNELHGEIATLQANPVGVGKSFNGNITLTAGVAFRYNHNLGLTNPAACFVGLYDSSGSSVSADVDIVDGNNVDITSLVGLTGIQIVVIG